MPVPSIYMPEALEIDRAHGARLSLPAINEQGVVMLGASRVIEATLHVPDTSTVTTVALTGVAWASKSDAVPRTFHESAFVQSSKERARLPPFDISFCLMLPENTPPSFYDEETGEAIRYAIQITTKRKSSVLVARTVETRVPVVFLPLEKPPAGPVATPNGSGNSPSSNEGDSKVFTYKFAEKSFQINREGTSVSLFVQRPLVFARGGRVVAFVRVASKAGGPDPATAVCPSSIEIGIVRTTCGDSEESRMVARPGAMVEHDLSSKPILPAITFDTFAGGSTLALKTTVSIGAHVCPSFELPEGPSASYAVRMSLRDSGIALTLPIKIINCSTNPYRLPEAYFTREGATAGA